MAVWPCLTSTGEPRTERVSWSPSKRGCVTIVEERSPSDAGQLGESVMAGIRWCELQGSGSSSTTSDEGEMWEEGVKHQNSICRSANRNRGQVEPSPPASPFSQGRGQGPEGLRMWLQHHLRLDIFIAQQEL